MKAGILRYIHETKWRVVEKGSWTRKDSIGKGRWIEIESSPPFGSSQVYSWLLYVLVFDIE